MVQQQHGTIERPTDRAELAEEHSRICWFLSILFLNCPTEESLLALQQQISSQHGQITLEPASGLARVFEVLSKGVNKALVERLAVEHTRLFCGLSRDTGPLPPYESLYRSDSMMGKVTLAVMDTYRQAGYGTIEEDAGPQDHIAAELRFMAILFYNETVALYEGDQLTAATQRQQQNYFLNEHLLQWVPAYCKRIKTETTESFYTGVAMMTEDALELLAGTAG